MIAGVVLAAGTSSRVGRPKMILPLGGRPVLQHVLDAAVAAGLEEIAVVLGHSADQIQREVEIRPPARAVINPDYESGQSSSLRAGLRALGPAARAAVILLGDQPGMGAEAIRRVIAEYGRTGGAVVQAYYRGARGHPVLLDRRVWADAEKVEGDRGARDLIERHPEWVVPVEFDREAPPDIDCWEDYERVRRGSGA